MLPLVLYSLVYLTMVAILQQWPDWYGFTFGGKYALIPVVMLVMYSFAALISWACIALQRKLAK